MQRGDKVSFTYDGETREGVVNYVTDTVLNIRKASGVYRSYTLAKVKNLSAAKPSTWQAIRNFLSFRF